MFVCRHGHEHPDELVDNWGEAGHGSGYGPEPVCTQLVKNPRTGSGQICKAQLSHRQEEIFSRTADGRFSSDEDGVEADPDDE